MFKRSVNFSPYEKDQLLQLIREYIVIFEDKRLDGVGRREKERAWLELTDRYNTLENVNIRTIKQLQACWKNLKNRARDVTNACKKGADIPFFTYSNKISSSYLPSTESEDRFDIRVKSESYSDIEDEDSDELSAVLPTQSPTSLSPGHSTTGDSPPAVTNYVYSPITSHPPTFIPQTPLLQSMSAPHLQAQPSKPQDTRGTPGQPSKLIDTFGLSPQRPEHLNQIAQRVENISQSSQRVDNVSQPSLRVDNIAARLSQSIQPYRNPERSISKSVDRIASSILFERGVSENSQSQSLFEPSISNPFPFKRNGLVVPDSLNLRESPWDKTCSMKPLNLKTIKSEKDQPKDCSKKDGHVNSSPKSMTSSQPRNSGVNGHISAIHSGRVNKSARYRRLEHQTRMKNLKYERECLEIEHKMRCELLELKIKYYKDRGVDKSHIDTMEDHE